MRTSRLTAWRCHRGHAQLHAAPACPACGAPVRSGQVAADARVIASTTVRVNPSGEPFVLGVAVTRCGRARTLCVVQGPLRGSGRDAVTLRSEDGVIVAVSRARGRFSGDNRGRPPRRED